MFEDIEDANMIDWKEQVLEYKNDLTDAIEVIIQNIVL